MADTAQPEVQTPAIETAPVVETQQAEPQTAAELHAALEAQLSDPNWTPEKSAPEVKTEEPEAKVEEVKTGETPVETAETKTAETPVETKPVDELPAGIERPRLSDPNDQVIAALKKAQPSLSWAECEARVMGTQAKAEPETTATEVADPLAAMQTELADIRTKLKEWGESETISSPEIVALIERQSELAAEIKSESKFRERDQKAATQQKQTAAQALDAQQQEQVAAATTRFPQIAVEGSAVRTEADRLLAELKGSAFLNKPTAPIELAEIATRNVAQAQAMLNGTSIDAEMAKLDTAFKPKSATVAATVTPVVTPPAKPAQPKITPAGGNRATQQPDKPATEQEKWNEGTSTDPKEEAARLNRLLYGAAA